MKRPRGGYQQGDRSVPGCSGTAVRLVRQEERCRLSLQSEEAVGRRGDCSADRRSLKGLRGAWADLHFTMAL